MPTAARRPPRPVPGPGRQPRHRSWRPGPASSRPGRLRLRGGPSGPGNPPSRSGVRRRTRGGRGTGCRDHWRLRRRTSGSAAGGGVRGGVPLQSARGLRRVARFRRQARPAPRRPERVEVLPVLLVGQPLQLHRLLDELGERHRGAGRGGDALRGRERGRGWRRLRAGRSRWAGPGRPRRRRRAARPGRRRRLRRRPGSTAAVRACPCRRSAGGPSGTALRGRRRRRTHMGQRPDPAAGQQRREAGPESHGHDLGAVGPPARSGFQGHRPADGEDVVGSAVEEQCPGEQQVPRSPSPRG